jgi:tetratricopeptide (TPR) repeat protein
MSEQAQEFIQQATQAIQNGQYAQALELVEQALAIDPTRGDAHILKGIALANSQQPAAATAAFRQAIVLNPSNPKAYYNLATHLYQIDQKAESLAMAEEAIRLDPSHAQAKDLVTLIRQESEAAAAASSPGPSGEPGHRPYGSPYGSEQPYAPPQSPYYRPGYEQPAHSLAFVENLGAKWPAIAWVIVAVSLGTLIAGIIFALPLFEHLGSPEELQAAAIRLQEAAGALVTLFNVLTYGVMAVGLTWIIMDLVDRRGNFLWLVPVVLCCCCGMMFIPLTLYLLFGRS